MSNWDFILGFVMGGAITLIWLSLSKPLKHVVDKAVERVLNEDSAPIGDLPPRKKEEIDGSVEPENDESQIV